MTSYACRTEKQQWYDVTGEWEFALFGVRLSGRTLANFERHPWRKLRVVCRSFRVLSPVAPRIRRDSPSTRRQCTRNAAQKQTCHMECRHSRSSCQARPAFHAPQITSSDDGRSCCMPTCTVLARLFRGFFRNVERQSAPRHAAFSTHSTVDINAISADRIYTSGSAGAIARTLTAQMKAKIARAPRTLVIAPMPVEITINFDTASASSQVSEFDTPISNGVSINDQPHTPNIANFIMRSSVILAGLS